MKRLMQFVLFATALGCQSEQGSLTYRKPGRADDPCYSIEEQRARGRERLAVIEDVGALAPKVYVDRPSPTGG
jgi:hypothetical protein